MEVLIRHWWALLLRGVAGILFGLLFLVWPLPSLATLVLLFGLWALLDGCAALAAAIGGRGGGYTLLEGVFGVVVGVVTFARPFLSALALYTVVAAWAFVTGLIKLVAAVRLRHVIRNEFWLGLSGVAAMLFGVLMVALPASGVLVLGWLIGVFALVEGALLLGLSLRLRRAAGTGAVLHSS